jgi:hypothetical protein
VCRRRFLFVAFTTNSLLNLPVSAFFLLPLGHQSLDVAEGPTTSALRLSRGPSKLKRSTLPADFTARYTVALQSPGGRASIRRRQTGFLRTDIGACTCIAPSHLGPARPSLQTWVRAFTRTTESSASNGSAIRAWIVTRGASCGYCSPPRRHGPISSRIDA